MTALPAGRDLRHIRLKHEVGAAASGAGKCGELWVSWRYTDCLLVTLQHCSRGPPPPPPQHYLQHGRQCVPPAPLARCSCYMKTITPSFDAIRACTVQDLHQASRFQCRVKSLQLRGTNICTDTTFFPHFVPFSPANRQSTIATQSATPLTTQHCHIYVYKQ